jgi:hypothetical protein
VYSPVCCLVTASTCSGVLFGQILESVTKGDEWVEPIGIDPPPQADELYPDLLRAGSLADALNEELESIGSPYRTIPSYYDRPSWSFAEFEDGDRCLSVYIHRQQRRFDVGLSEDAVYMAEGGTANLAEVATGIDCLLSKHSQRVSELVESIPFMKITDRARGYEDGTYIDDRWRSMLENPIRRGGREGYPWDELHQLIQQAAEHPELRRHLPFTSLIRFSVTRRRQLPEKAIPLIFPLGDGRYRLVFDSDPSLSFDGSASEVLDGLANAVREAAPREPGTG